MGSPLYSGVQLDIRYKRPEHFLSIFLEENKKKKKPRECSPLVTKC